MWVKYTDTHTMKKILLILIPKNFALSGFNHLVLFLMKIDTSKMFMKNSLEFKMFSGRNEIRAVMPKNNWE